MISGAQTIFFKILIFFQALEGVVPLYKSSSLPLPPPSREIHARGQLPLVLEKKSIF